MVLEDIVWDELGGGDDHIVPQPSDGQLDDCAPEADCHKKPRFETASALTKNADSKYISEDAIREKKKERFPILKDGKNPMLERGSWSCTPDGVFHASCDTDSINEVTSLTSDDTKILGNCFNNCNVDSIDNGLCADDPMLGSRSSGMDGSLCHFPLGDISPAGSDLEFFRNENEDKENGDLLYYGWPDIGNFEDVDQMFSAFIHSCRSCDSTFGQRNPGNGDEMPWFSSSSHAIDSSGDPPKGNGINGAEDKISSVTKTKNATGMMITLQSKHPKQQNQFMNVRPPLSVPSATENFHSPDGLEPKQDIKPDFLSYLHTSTPFLPHHAQPMEGSSDTSPKAPAIKSEEKMDKLHLQHQVEDTLVRDTQHEESVQQSSFTDQITSQRYMQWIQDEVGGNSEVEGVSTELLPVEVDSSTVQESSCMSSALPNEVSVDETSFQQLQYVMGQLDIRTKLCIRDSLYRLARSAEQRHNFGNSNYGSRDVIDRNGVLKTEELNKCSRFMDIETETNPIDRSIAHLLFHRPSNLSTSAANESLSQESRARVHSSLTSQPVTSEKPVS
ncbi:PREDICTED: protein LNK1-like isoform X2 [Nelumbo nucifera]|uniref:Protein LNK1-like isoform X2 n=1 Tax=Nelumbo nucifera TaxID=4432 RepID=A0A1U8B118_NELNU|nr:PREDICTED: protein LNK1-like isoform X2 [Nelumbo nucifera]